MVGTRVAHYEIVEKVGQGGMGAVYKARDTHLDRFVAIKVLPPERVADSLRRRRFVQEAKAASALNHPNIVHIYDISSEDGRDFIAMEYVEGRTLEQIIPSEGMELREALRSGVQIADALARAHAAGIVHRDLKPANIMLDEHGLVKVLDFGLAKLTEASTGEDGATATMDVMTEEGAIVGTVAYMSPEQAEAKPIDSRSDIFSLGAVLYEMVTGQKAFRGESKLSILMEVKEKEPPPLDPGIPQEVERIIRRCLRKEPARRFQTMADLRVALEEAREESDSTAGAAGRGASAPRQFSRPALAAGALGALALAAAAWLWLGRPGPETPLRAVPLTTYGGAEFYPSFSPDGNQVAFSWMTPDPKQGGIYVKMIGAETAQRRSNGAAPYFSDLSPAWSPDGRWIAMLGLIFPKQSVRLVPSIGGAERKLADVTLPNGVTTGTVGPFLAWSADSKWLIVVDRPRGQEAALFALAVGTGERRQLTFPPPQAPGDTSPAISQDGRLLAFVRTVRPLVADLYVQPLAADMTPRGEARRLTFDERWTGGAAWRPDGRELVYSAGTPPALWRVRASGSGKPQRLALGGEQASDPAVSQATGRLVFTQTTADFNIYRADLAGIGGPAGAPVKIVSSTRREDEPSLALSGSRLTFVSDRSGTPEIWVSDPDGSNPVQLTNFAGQPVLHPVLSPDGNLIAFEASARGGSSTYVVGAQGGAPKQLKTEPPGRPSSWSRDGKRIYFTSSSEGQPWARSANVWWATPGGGPPVQVTRDGGRHGVESPDGKDLYYVRGSGINGSLYRVPLAGGAETKVFDGLRDDCSFVVVEQGVYVLPIRGGSLFGDASLHFLHFATGATKPVAGLEHIQHRFDLSADGRSVFFARADQQNADLMLVERFR